ncbi:MAG: hypothetical protein WCK31_03710 [bacterium]
MGLFGNKQNEDELKLLREKVSELEKKSIEKEEKPEEFDTPLEVIFNWKSPSRVFVARDRSWFLKVAAIFLVIILLLAFLQEIVLIVVLIALLGLIYILSTVPPDIAEHEITNRGIRSFEKMYYWKELGEYWFSIKQGFTLLNIDTKMRFPSRIIMIVKPGDEKEMTKILSKKLTYLQLPLDKKQGWLARTSDGVYQSKEEILFGEEEKTSKSPVDDSIRN